MQKGDIVKFKKVVDVGDEDLRMVLREDPDGGRVLVVAIVDMYFKPTHRYNVEDLEVCGQITDKAMQDETIERMKREVLKDVKLGKVPSTVKTFAELHDYVDANEYGGFCDEAFSDMLTQHFGGPNKKTGMPQGMLDFMNAAQNAIDTWIKEGGLLE
jgi:hypothetical protein